MANLFVEIGTVFFFDDFAALLTDGLVELDAVTLTGCLPPLASYLFIESRAITVSNGIAAFLAGLTDRHLATRLLVVGLAFGGFCHYLTPVDGGDPAPGS